MSISRFEEEFAALTGHHPMPWQETLYERFASGVEGIPRYCDIPTGLGKTSVIAVWLIALARHPDKMPRRLVYVVNRRTVVDQTTDEVEKLRRNLMVRPELQQLRDDLGGLAISTLRGQFADNQEWSADPSRPAVICGTVDMIGSRLLFNGYRIGFRSQPLHAGFLGQDVLLVHDEAHLEPAFQKLIEAVESEQQRECGRPDSRRHSLPVPNLRVMALSATARESGTGKGASANGDVLGLSDEDHSHEEVMRRIDACKRLFLHPIECVDEKGKPRKPAEVNSDLVAELVERAKGFHDSGRAVLVFVRRVEDVEKIVKKLPDDATEQLTGTLRGWERDKLVASPVFQRFLPEPHRNPEVGLFQDTVYLVCTSAGEVGVNISADHLVCDLTTFDSMAQRFGRVNRFGDRDDTEIHVVHPTVFGTKDKSGKVKKSELDTRRERTLTLLERLEGDASPRALGQLDAGDRQAAFAPEPKILPVNDILFDKWSLTTIRDKTVPGRPPVEPYLHGVTEWEPPRTEVAWREEVAVITGDLLERHPPKDLLDDYPLKPHELLTDRSDRVFKELVKMANRCPDASAWLIGDDGSIEVTTIGRLADMNPKDRINIRTVLLPPEAGGLRSGMLDGKAEFAGDVEYDISDKWIDERNRPRRIRVWDDAEAAAGMALIRTIDTKPDADEFDPSETEEEISGETRASRRFWYWYVMPRDTDDVTPASIHPVTLMEHTRDVIASMEKLARALRLPEEFREAFLLAAELHDLGKRREVFQRSIGNPKPSSWYAKPGKPEGGPRWRPRRISTYRHEFGSILDVLDPDQEFFMRVRRLDEEMRDLLLHVIAAHHGRARPHFPEEESFDPTPGTSERARAEASETFRRFARLQRRYGRWGLAYLESLLRAADWEASTR